MIVLLGKGTTNSDLRAGSSYTLNLKCLTTVYDVFALNDAIAVITPLRYRVNVSNNHIIHHTTPHHTTPHHTTPHHTTPHHTTTNPRFAMAPVS